MKDPVRPRNEDPGQRSRDRNKWHEDDERDKLQRKKFWIHVFVDVLLVVASAWFAVDFYTKELQSEKAELQKQVTELKAKLSARKN